MEASLAEARAWAASAQKVRPPNLQLRLSCGGATVTVSAAEFAWDGEGAIADARGGGLAASVEGLVATPLANWLGEKVRNLFQEEDAGEGSWAVRHKGHMYGLEVLHYAAELLETGDEGHGDAELVRLPRSFPWRDVDPSLRSLQLLLQAEAQYYSTAEGGMEEALVLLEQARAIDSGNAMIELRRGAALFRLNRRREAIACLAAQQRQTPKCGRIYWRLGYMLVQDENTLRSALCTMHGGLKHGIHRTRSYSKIVSLARKCVLLIWGSAALGGNSGYLPNGVLQMVLDELPIWDVLRVSCVCFSWSTLASQNSYWTRRVMRDFGVSLELEKNSVRKIASKERYRILLLRSARVIRVVDWAIPELIAHRQPVGYVPSFFVFDENRDVMRMVWMAWLRYLERRGFKPEHCGAFVAWGNEKKDAYDQVWTLGGAVFNDRVQMRNTVLVVPSKEVGMLFCSMCRGFVRPDQKEELTCVKRHASPSYPMSVCLSPTSEAVKNALTPASRRVLFLEAQRMERDDALAYMNTAQHAKAFQRLKETRRFFPCCGAEAGPRGEGLDPCTPGEHYLSGKTDHYLRYVATLPFVPGDANNVDCMEQKLNLRIGHLVTNSAIREDSPLTGMDAQFGKKHVRSKAEFTEAFATQQSFGDQQKKK